MTKAKLQEQVFQNPICYSFIPFWIQSEIIEKKGKNPQIFSTLPPKAREVKLLYLLREVKLLYLPLTRENRKFSGMTRDVIGFKMEWHIWPTCARVVNIISGEICNCSRWYSILIWIYNAVKLGIKLYFTAVVRRI